VLVALLQAVPIVAGLETVAPAALTVVLPTAIVYASGKMSLTKSRHWSPFKPASATVKASPVTEIVAVAIVTVPLRLFTIEAVPDIQGGGATFRETPTVLFSPVVVLVFL